MAPDTHPQAPFVRSLIRTASLLALLAAAPASLAQITTGTILGTVSDASGAVVPGATITATHLDTGAVRTAVSDSAGGYLLAALPIGSYKVRAELQGFKTAVAGPPRLVAGHELRAGLPPSGRRPGRRAAGS